MRKRELLLLAGVVLFTSAFGMTIKNSDGTVLFENNGFELDKAGNQPSFSLEGSIRSKKDVDKIYNADSKGPGAYKGTQYVCTSRDSSSSGSTEFRFKKAANKIGQTLCFEWAWYLPGNANAKWGLLGDKTFYKSLWRAGGGIIQVYNDGAWSKCGTYPTDEWFVCRVEYTIGKEEAVLTVNGKSFSLKVDNYQGGTKEVAGIFFAHNALDSYYIDGITEIKLDMANMVPGNVQDSNVSIRPELSEILKISWERLPNTPRGIQWPGVGILGDLFVSVGGWCSGEEVPSKPDIYPRGYFNDVFAIDLKNPATGWRRLPDFPGSARMGTAPIAVDGKLYMWGGLNYDEPYTYKDGYVLEQVNGEWTWHELPPLPFRSVFAGSCAIESKIYVFGGTDYNRKQYYTETDRTGEIKGLGKKMLVFDTKDPDAGWKELAPCPGTARLDAGVASVRGKIYVMGGVTGKDSPNNRINTIVDNWRYDPATDQWTRLKDLPIGSSNFPAGEIAYKDRYILLVGGAQFPDIQYPDGTVEASKSYGLAKMFYPQYVSKKETFVKKPQRYTSDIFVYDTQTDSFAASTILPFNNNMTKVVIRDDNIYMISGETGGLEFEGEYYGHHPDFFLKGIIQMAEKKAAN